MANQAYDLHNPTPAARVIYDGITNSKKIRVLPGETVKDVVLADHVVEKLRRHAALGENADLRVTIAKPATAAKPRRGAKK